MEERQVLRPPRGSILTVSNTDVYGEELTLRGDNNRGYGPGIRMEGKGNEIHGKGGTGKGTENQIWGEGKIIGKGYINGVKTTGSRPQPPPRADQVRVQNPRQQATLPSPMPANVLRWALALVVDQEPPARKRERTEDSVGGIQCPTASDCSHDTLKPENREGCIICLENERRCLLLPCDHMICCVKCSRDYLDHGTHVPTCPQCRVPIERIKLIYK